MLNGTGRLIPMLYPQSFEWLSILSYYFNAKWPCGKSSNKLPPPDKPPPSNQLPCTLLLYCITFFDWKEKSREKVDFRDYNEECTTDYSVCFVIFQFS